MALAGIFEQLTAEQAGVGFRGCDGSALRRPEALGVIEVRSPRYLATAPGELGLVRAYVTGEIEIHGDLHATLHVLLARGPIPWKSLLLGTRRWMLRRPPIPTE